VGQESSQDHRDHGRTLTDNYFWARARRKIRVKAYLDARMSTPNAVMKPTRRIAEKAHDEMLSRIKETDVEVPYKEGGYFYYCGPSR